MSSHEGMTILVNSNIKCFNDKIKPLIENTFNVKFNVEVM